MQKKVLIANRGEIACRIIRTAKQLGFITVAVYSEVDAQALHVKMADESYPLGGTTSQQSYLNAEKILQIALAHQVDMIHPGYGFLAENADFAQQCLERSIIFIGPSPEVIRVMGEKDAAKKIAQKANVPIIPGYMEAEQDSKKLQQAAQKIGYPILIKAVAGGGGKGMRIVNNDAEFQHALEGAQREAQNSFGNSRVMLEKYFADAHHIEVQIFGDQHGNAISLYERDCSIQRRHQKIIEETRSPFINDTQRQEMYDAAVRLAQSVKYESAGTIEFLVDEKQQFYFMEMNTRLQVEHPITEMITGLDLVAWQFDIALGKSLSDLLINPLQLQGHAIEARLYAEDPTHNFLPTTGKIKFLHFPHSTPKTRIDTGVQTGDSIQAFYDPMIAKIICHGKNRTEAIHLLQKALNNTYLAGLYTNTQLLLNILNEPHFKQGTYNTNYIASHPQLVSEFTVTDELFALAAHLLVTTAAEDLSNPWNMKDNLRINLANKQLLNIVINQQEKMLSLIQVSNINCYVIDEQSFNITPIYRENQNILLNCNDKNHSLSFYQEDNKLYLFLNGQVFQCEWALSASSSHVDPNESKARFTAPMPGTIVNIHIQAGQTVEKGEQLLVIEAMKMEHTLFAPSKGIVKDIFFNVGDMIQEGVELIQFEVLEEFL